MVPPGRAPVAVADGSRVATAAGNAGWNDVASCVTKPVPATAGSVPPPVRVLCDRDALDPEAAHEVPLHGGVGLDEVAFLDVGIVRKSGEIQAAVDYAQDLPVPGPADQFHHHYEELDWILAEQRDRLLADLEEEAS